MTRAIRCAGVSIHRQVATGEPTDLGLQLIRVPRIAGQQQERPVQRPAKLDRRECSAGTQHAADGERSIGNGGQTCGNRRIEQEFVRHGRTGVYSGAAIMAQTAFVMLANENARQSRASCAWNSPAANVW